MRKYEVEILTVIVIAIVIGYFIYLFVKWKQNNT